MLESHIKIKNTKLKPTDRSSSHSRCCLAQPGEEIHKSTQYRDRD